MASLRESFKDFSKALTEAVEIGAEATVQVRARRGYAASGVAYRADRVLTANHAVEQNEGITVVLPDGKEIGASLAGRHPRSDLALLRLDEAAAVPGAVTEEESVVGQIVLALARPTDEGIQASLGIVGIAGGRYQPWRGGSIEGVIRSDAVQFPGFAGGPLVDTDGKIVGINCFGFRFGSSITIPVKRAWEIAERLEKEGSVKRGYMGVRTQIVDLPDSLIEEGRQEAGLLIVGLEKGGAAEQAELLVGDILVGLQGNAIDDHRSLIQMMEDRAGKRVSLQIVRAGKVQDLSLTLGEAPDVIGRMRRAHRGHPRGHHRSRRR
jgi:S1-C subfamily serine protease